MGGSKKAPKDAIFQRWDRSVPEPNPDQVRENRDRTYGDVSQIADRYIDQEGIVMDDESDR